MSPTVLSRWTMPLLRAGMGVFLATWGIDKLLATEGSVGGAHLFLASIVITAASVVLVLNARDSRLTLDRRLGRVDRVDPAGEPSTGPAPGPPV